MFQQLGKISTLIASHCQLIATICCSLMRWRHDPTRTRLFIHLPHVQALIWSKMSTGLPIEILSSMKGQSYSSFCRLDIDINKYDSYIFQNFILESFCILLGIEAMGNCCISGIFLTFTYTKRERTTKDGMELISR